MGAWKLELDALVKETTAFASTVSFNIGRERRPPREMIEPTGLKPLDFGGSEREEIVKGVQSFRLTVPICRLHRRERHRRGNERSWWQSQGIDPLPVAARFWERTHAIASAATELADHIDLPTRLDRKRLGNRFGAAVQHQNDETKPMHSPEAG